MNALEVRQLWVYCQEAWGSTFVIPEDVDRRKIKLQVWLDVLGDLDADLVRRTVVGMDGHFAPTPSELRILVLDRATIEAGQPRKPDADEALGELYRLMGKFGYTHEAQVIEAAEAFAPALVATIRAIGWKKCCEDENAAVFRGQFVRLYETASNRIVREQHDAKPAPALAARLTPEIAKTTGPLFQPLAAVES